MDIHKVAAWAQVMALPFGAYCAWGTYVNLHPGGVPPVIFNSTAFYISFGAFGACLLIIGIAFLWDKLRSSTGLPPAIQGHRSAEITFARHWRGQAQGSSDELQVAIAENAELLKSQTIIANQLEATTKLLKDETNAKMDREGRLQEARKQHEEFVAQSTAELAVCAEKAEKWRSELEHQAIDRGKRNQILMSLRTIKQNARKLRSHGAPASFSARPLDRDLWINDGEGWWKQSACKWFEDVMTDSIVKKMDGALLRSLDFDELMGELDESELSAMDFTATFHQASGDDPMVAISTFVDRNGEYGVLVYNFGVSLAKDIEVVPFQIGRFRFTSDSIDLLPGGSEKKFVRTVATEGQTRWQDLELEGAIQEYSKCFGCDHLPISVFVTYKDRHGHEFITRHEVRIEHTKALVYVRRFEGH